MSDLTEPFERAVEARSGLVGEIAKADPEIIRGTS
jgi:hypothetical protein